MTRVEDNAMVSRQLFLGTTAVLFLASTAVTIAWCAAMSTMGGMPMPGGWTMSMTWMRMPGQPWAAAFAEFLGMWITMMVAMMLPSLVPMLERSRHAVLAGLGYFFVWTIAGAIVFLLGIALAAVEMQQPAISRAVPFAAAAIVMIASALQLTPWKERSLACCKWRTGNRACPPSSSAFRHGIRLGIECARCCGNLMVILLVAGVMDLRVMAVVTAAITAERLAPAGLRIARFTGLVGIATGLLMIA